MTLIEREKRGNFRQIDQLELERVKKAVVRVGDDYEYFKPQDVDVRLFRNFENEEHRLSRLRSIFYVLSGLGYMDPAKDGNELLFAVTHKLISEFGDEES